MALKISIADKLPLPEAIAGGKRPFAGGGDRIPKAVKIVGFGLLGAAALTVLGVFFARDQMVRHRRELFSPQPLRRLAALAYLRSRPQIDNVLLLRDYLAWEDRPLLRKRAATILEEMEASVAEEEASGLQTGA